MNITLISRQKNLLRVKTVGNQIAEYYRDMKYPGQIKIRLFDPARNTILDIAPSRRITNRIDVNCCIWNCRDLYYACWDKISENSIEISVFRYETLSGKESRICSFIRSNAWLNKDRRIRLFILNENMLLMQTEINYGNVIPNRMGNIAFSLSLFNLDNAEETAVTEANIQNNGIDLICPLSDSRILIKTGYSCLNDYRIDPDVKEQAYIESVYITTTAKFIADITLKKDFVDMPLIESAYFDKHITHPAVSGDYVHFSVTDSVNRALKCVFFNFLTEERLEYIIQSYNPKDIDVTYVIRNHPYIRKSGKEDVDFINLEKAEIDISFYDEMFLDQTGSVFILASRSGRSKLRLYTYPGLLQVLSEERSFFCSVCIGENHYIYC